MERRELLGAVATVIGATAGCVSPNDTTMTQDEAKSKFDDVQKFEEPSGDYEQPIRFVDSEAGVVLYGVTNESINGEGVSITGIPLEDTDLAEE